MEVQSPYSVIFRGTPYVETEIKSLNGRLICKYLFDNSSSDALNQAVNAVENLFSQYINLIPTFEINSLRTEIEENKFLIINGRAVCLAQEKSAPLEAGRELKDKAFSENLLEEPIVCSKGHYLEMRRAHFWMERAGQNCPLGEDHIINVPLTVDQELREDITNFLQSINNRENLDRSVVVRQTAQHLQNMALTRDVNQQRNQLTRISGIDPVAAVGSIGKIVLKAGGKEIAFMTFKYFGKELAKNAAKNTAKYAIPGLSLLIGTCFGIYRVTQGQYKRAIGEIVSGAAACIPIAGIPISIVIDAGILCCDLYEPMKVWYNKDDSVATVELSLNYCYQTLGINIRDNPNPTKDQIDLSYRNNVQQVHPDQAVNLGEYTQEQLQEITQLLNMVRDEIYRHHGW
jgi:hypothetical protein